MFSYSPQKQVASLAWSKRSTPTIPTLLVWATNIPIGMFWTEIRRRTIIQYKPFLEYCLDDVYICYFLYRFGDQPLITSNLWTIFFQQKSVSVYQILHSGMLIWIMEKIFYFLLMIHFKCTEFYFSELLIEF